MPFFLPSRPPSVCLPRNLNRARNLLFYFFWEKPLQLAREEVGVTMEAACGEYSVLLTVFSFLDARDILKNAALVSKVWCSVTQESLVC